MFQQLKVKSDVDRDAQAQADEPMSEADDERLAAATELTRTERGVALRALAGQLAHQMRNPLAAIRAACSSLREDLSNEEHRQRLDMTLHEVDRLLTLVTGTVKSVSAKPEKPRKLDLADEIQEVVAIARDSLPNLVSVKVSGATGVQCLLPRSTFRASLFSLLDHVVDTYRPDPLRVELRHSNGRAQIDFKVAAQHVEDAPGSYHQTTLARSGDGRSIGLVVAERFARDNGGRLAHFVNANDSQSLTLDLPCTDV